MSIKVITGIEFCSVDDSAGCGYGKCVNNGTLCTCQDGYLHDTLTVFYNNCYMPTWFPALYSASIIIIAFVVLIFGLYQLSRPRGQLTKNVYATVCVGLTFMIAFVVALTATDVLTNVASWTIYLLLMFTHVCILVPMVVRFLIPPIYRMVLVYPKWFDASVAGFVAFATITLLYSWIFALIGLITDDGVMFNTGVHIWLAACALLTLVMTTTIVVAIKQLIAVLDNIFSKKDPFFKDLSVLRRRTVAFRNLTLFLGTICFSMLFTMVFLDFYLEVYPYRFVLFYILSLFLILFDGVVIWFTRSGSTKNRLSTPKSNVGLDSEPSEPYEFTQSRTPSQKQQQSVGTDRRLSFTGDGDPPNRQYQYPSSITGVSRVGNNNNRDQVSEDSSFVDVAVV